MADGPSPYLLQRGTIKPNSVAGARLSDAVALGYMGSSEFEFGAMPKSLRELAGRVSCDRKCLDLVRLESVRDRDGRPLIGLGLRPENWAAHEVAIARVVAGASMTKEATNFEDMVTPVAELPSWHGLRREPPKGHKRGNKRLAWEAQTLSRLTNFWWDIDHSAMMSFEAEFMERLPGHLRGSWSHMGIPGYAAAPEAAAEAGPAPR